MENGIVQEGHIAEGGRRRRRCGEEILGVVMQIVQTGCSASFVASGIVSIIDVHITFQGPVQADWAQSQQRSCGK